MRETRTESRASGLARQDQAARESAAWPALKDLLLVGTEREILARIVPEDPLGLLELCGRRLRERNLILDADRVVLRAFALTASQASSWRGRPGLAPWLAARVDEAIDQVLAEAQARLAADAVFAADPDAPASEDAPRESRHDAFGSLAFFAGPLGLDAAALDRACVRFNLLEASDREAFFHIAIEGHSLDAVCAERGLPVSVLARRVRRALDVLRGADSLPPSPPSIPSSPPFGVT